MKRVCIIGAGASGCICAYFLTKAGIDVILYDKQMPLKTLLPTGGGRCNLAHAEYDYKELAKNYPRGEKFLYSVFSQFSTSDTINLFRDLGVETYTQDDDRIFPTSNSSKDVRKKILDKLKECHFIRQDITDLRELKESYSDIVIATGGHSGYKILKELGVNIIEPHASLVGLNTQENFSHLSGTAINNVSIDGCWGDILFTHYGVSGPLVYKISSLKAFDKFPYDLTIDLYPKDIDLQNILNSESHKSIKNIINQFIPNKLAEYILEKNNISPEIKAHQIDGKTRDLILNAIHNFKINVMGTNKGEETVTAGGADLNEINSKTMEIKKLPHIYCIGEVLNIDGLCGGFNLQNAWSTAYIAASAIIEAN